MSRDRTCLATVTSDRFLPGAIVLLHSFLAHHPGWGGDLVVVHDDGLTEAGRATLAAAFDGVRVVEVSATLTARLDRLMAARPGLADRRARFLSLEVFRLDYDRVLFADSDVLVRAPLADLFERDEPLLAAGDRPYYEGGGRDRRTFERLPPEVMTPDALRSSFNAGLLRIAPAALPSDTYDALLARLDPAGWGAVTAGQTDQRVLNLHFEGRVTFLPPADNYLLAHRRVILDRTGASFADARALHYNHPWKPWHVERLPDRAARDATAPVTWRLWMDAYFDAVQARCARTRLPELVRTHG